MVKRLARSGAWAALDTFSAAFLAFAFFVISARLLSPVEFGIAMLVLSIYQMIQPLIDSLFNDAIVQKERLDPEDITTATTFCIGWSVLLAAALWLLAPSLARLLSVPSLSTYLPVLGLGLVWCGMSAIVSALARREMQFKSLAIRTVCARLIGLIVGTWMALVGYGVWAIVGQILVTAFFSTLLLVIRTGIPVGAVHWERLKPFLAFAGPTAGTQFFLFASTRVMTLIIGGVLGPLAAGLWGVGFRFVEPIMVVFATTVGQTTLPLFSRKQGDRAAIAGYFGIGTHAMAAVFVPVFVGLAYCAPDVIRIFVGEQWVGAAPIMRIVCLGTVAIVLRQVAEIALISLGKPGLVFRTHALGAVLSLIGVAAGILFGLIPAALGWALRTVPFLTLNTIFVRREIGLDARRQYANTGSALVGSVVMGGVLYGVESLLPGDLHPGTRLALLIPVGAVTYAVSLVAIDARARRMIRAIIRGRSPLA